MWDHRVVEKLEEVVGQYLVSYRFKNVSDQLEWGLSSVYDPKLQYVTSNVGGISRHF